jgi:hypothetical protein
MEKIIKLGLYDYFEMLINEIDLIVEKALLNNDFDPNLINHQREDMVKIIKRIQDSNANHPNYLNKEFCADTNNLVYENFCTEYCFLITPFVPNDNNLLNKQLIVIDKFIDKEISNFWEFLLHASDIEGPKLYYLGEWAHLGEFRGNNDPNRQSLSFQLQIQNPKSYFKGLIIEDSFVNLFKIDKLWFKNVYIIQFSKFFKYLFTEKVDLNFQFHKMYFFPPILKDMLHNFNTNKINQFNIKIGNQTLSDYICEGIMKNFC